MKVGVVPHPFEYFLNFNVHLTNTTFKMHDEGILSLVVEESLVTKSHVKHVYVATSVP